MYIGNIKTPGWNYSWICKDWEEMRNYILTDINTNIDYPYSFNPPLLAESDYEEINEDATLNCQEATPYSITQAANFFNDNIKK